MTELQLRYCNEKGLIYIKPENTEIADYVTWLEEQIQALAISIVGSAFYCQRDIEGDSICDTQCEHCNEYYKPLEQ